MCMFCGLRCSHCSVHLPCRMQSTASSMRWPSCSWTMAPRSTARARSAITHYNSCWHARISGPLTWLFMQFVGIGESDMASVLTRMPNSFEDVDTDWEIDPNELHSSDKLGGTVTQRLRICSCSVIHSKMLMQLQEQPCRIMHESLDPTRSRWAMLPTCCQPTSIPYAAQGRASSGLCTERCGTAQPWPSSP